MIGIGIKVRGETPTGKKVVGTLSGNGAGKYTSVLVDGKPHAVVKSTISPLTETVYGGGY